MEQIYPARPEAPIRATEDDVARLIRAMRPLLNGPAEAASLNGIVAQDSVSLEIRLLSSSFYVPPNSLQITRKTREWNVLAEGVLSELRNRHSLLPQRSFELHELYSEALKVVTIIAAGGLTPHEIQAIEDLVSVRISGLRDRSAILKCTVDTFSESIVSALKQTIPEAAHA